MLPAPHLQYIHFPQRHFSVMHRQFSGLPLYLRAANELLCRTVAGSLRINLEKSHLLTNSAWSREQLLRYYGVPAEVVYPPVRIPQMTFLPWAKRDLAVVVAGRFHPQKRLHDAISIVEKVRSRFPALKLHIVGFGGGEYKRHIEKLALARKTFVTVHDNISRPALGTLMSSCRFGIHCTPDEHFGMAPAELAAAGCLVFVHNSGGQVEIVDRDPALVFNDLQEACQKICWQIENSEIAAQKAQHYTERARMRFSSDCFTSRVGQAVRVLVDRACPESSNISDESMAFRGKETPVRAISR
jgi:glycosyltransferase involved in cell wall biosynthesis